MDSRGSMRVFWPVSFASILCVTLFDTTPKIGSLCQGFVEAHSVKLRGNDDAYG
jgi:hypothetical protein